MIGVRRRPLDSRLRAHVVSEFDRADHGWWTPRSSARPLSTGTPVRVIWWRLIARRRRTAELAYVVELLAVLIGAGCSLSVAIDRVLQRGRGLVIEELAIVRGWMREGQPAVRALRRWSMTTSCDMTGRLAAAVAATASVEELAQRLHVLADVAYQRVHDEQLAAMQRIVRIVWATWLLAVVAALAVAVP
jgi:type II secretory pathway component PulF